MHVPFIDLSRAQKNIRSQVLQDWTCCLDATEFVGGKSVTRLEDALSKRLEVPHFIACANGTDALIIALQAIGIKPGMRVALPNMNFWAPYEAIVQLGAVPVLIDIALDDLQMCFPSFTKTHKTLGFDAAIFVHLFGWTSSKLADFRTYCKEHSIKLVEDGAQAFNVRVNGRSVFRDADIATISFYPAKVLGGASDGGGITAQDPEIANRMRSLCNHGRSEHYDYQYVGWNSRMGGLNACFLLCMLKQIDEAIASRQKALHYYSDFFAGNDCIKMYTPPTGVTSNGYLAVITCKNVDGDTLVARMKERDIACARTYPKTLDQQLPAKDALKASDLSNSHWFSKQVINLPVFSGITEKEYERAAHALQESL